MSTRNGRPLVCRCEKAADRRLPRPWVMVVMVLLLGWRTPPAAAQYESQGQAARGPASAPTTSRPAIVERDPPFELAATRWQTLPTDIRFVFSGPDRRIWSVVGDVRGPLDLTDAKAQIAAQFRRPRPILDRVRPVLFEAGGRTWFVTDRNRWLIGYDGQTWIERQAIGERGFVGHPPGEGWLFWAGDNLALGDKRFFLEGSGVHVFDGHDWTYQAFSVEVPTRAQYWLPVLLPQPDGQGVVAVTLKLPQADFIWWYRQGTWLKLTLPPQLRQGTLTGAAVLKTNVLWLTTHEGQLWSVELGPSVHGASADERAAAAEKVRELLAPLVGDNVAERETALGQVSRMGPLALPALLDEVARAEGWAANQRLAVAVNRATEIQPREVRLHADVYQLEGRKPQLYQAADGTAFLPVERLVHTAQVLGKALVVIGPDGATTHLAAPAWYDSLGQRNLQILPIPGTSLAWERGGTDPLAGGSLLDLSGRALRVVNVLPRQYGLIQCVMADGTTVIGRFNDWISSPQATPLQVFQPAYPP